MLMGRFSTSFFAMNFILLFAAISLVFAVFDLHRLAFVFELAVLLATIFFFVFAMFSVYHGRRWGWTLLAAILALLMLNTLFIYLLTKTFDTPHMTIVIFSAAGLAISLVNLKAGAKPEIQMQDNEKAKDYYPYIDKMEPEEIKQESIEKTFTPGKFIASRNANKFHAAKCDWAKRISKPNQLWFNSRGEAEAKGFQADTCVN